MNFGSNDLNNIDDCHLITNVEGFGKKDREKREKKNQPIFIWFWVLHSCRNYGQYLNYIIVL